MKKIMPPGVQADLRKQEQFAAKQNQKRDKNGKLILDPSIYGPTKALGTINMKEELDFMETANIINKDVKEHLLGEPMSPKPEALKAAGFTAPEQVEESVSEEVTEEEIEEDCSYCLGTGKVQKETILTDEQKYEFLTKDLISRFDRVPSIAQLKEWKTFHGSLFILDLNDRVFIYRYIKAQEFKQMLSGAWAQMEPTDQKQYVVDKCLLWPQYNLIEKNALPAGVIDLLSDQVNLQSMFLDPVAVARSTMKI